MEKTIKPMPGMAGFLIIVVLIATGVFCLTQMHEEPNPVLLGAGILLLVTGAFLMRGLMIIPPNHARVLNFFGKYSGTVKENGWWFVNPFNTVENISLRSQNLESSRLKVNDKMGNPIEIAAVIVWQVG